MYAQEDILLYYWCVCVLCNILLCACVDCKIYLCVDFIIYWCVETV